MRRPYRAQRRERGLRGEDSFKESAVGLRGTGRPVRKPALTDRDDVVDLAQRLDRLRGVARRVVDGVARLGADHDARADDGKRAEVEDELGRPEPRPLGRAPIVALRGGGGGGRDGEDERAPGADERVDEEDEADGEKDELGDCVREKRMGDESAMRGHAQGRAGQKARTVQALAGVALGHDSAHDKNDQARDDEDARPDEGDRARVRPQLAPDVERGREDVLRKGKEAGGASGLVDVERGRRSSHSRG